MNQKNKIVTLMLFTLLSFSIVSCQSKEKNVIEYKGGVVTQKEVNNKARMDLYQNQQERYRIQISTAEQLLFEKILEKEAQKGGKTIDGFLEEYVAKNFIPVSEDFVKNYYNANKAQIGQPYETVKEGLAGFLNRNMQEQLLQDYYTQLQKEYEIKVVLKEPSPPTTKIDLGDDPTLSGNKSSKIQVVEFSDFECPYCRKMQQDSLKIRKKFGDKIHWVFKDFPLPMHQQAMQAHIAVNCSQKQNKYAEMHDKLFDMAPNLSTENIEKAVQELGLEMEQFKNCLLDKDGSLKKEIEQDIEYGQKIGVSGTPALFINGKFYNGYIPASQLEKILEAELN